MELRAEVLYTPGPAIEYPTPAICLLAASFRVLEIKQPELSRPEGSIQSSISNPASRILDQGTNQLGFVWNKVFEFDLELASDFR